MTRLSHDQLRAFARGNLSQALMYGAGLVDANGCITPAGADAIATVPYLVDPEPTPEPVPETEACDVCEGVGVRRVHQAQGQRGKLVVCGAGCDHGRVQAPKPVVPPLDRTLAKQEREPQTLEVITTEVHNDGTVTHAKFIIETPEVTHEQLASWLWEYSTPVPYNPHYREMGGGTFLSPESSWPKMHVRTYAAIYANYSELTPEAILREASQFDV